MLLKRKRTLTEEKRVFNSKWEQGCFMIETAAHSMMCLICNQVVKTVKKDNAKQHFRRHESHSYAKLKENSRKICIEKLKNSMRKQTACITTFAKSINTRCKASHRVTYHLGVAEKPELVKRCFVDVVKCIHTGKEADYSSIALSRVTMQRRQDDIAQQFKLSLQAKINKKESLFLLAVDESTEINDSAQLLIFVRCLSSSFELCEDFLFMETLATCTRGEDLFIAVKNACIRSGSDLKYLRGICTDGAPAMTSNQQGFVTRFSDYVSNEYDSKELINLHCIIHREASCAKSVALNTILKDVNCIILLIRANSLHHQQL